VKKNHLLALASALLLWLGWPPMPYTSPLLLVAFVPLLMAIERILRGSFRKKDGKVFWLGFLTGFVWNTASIYWVYNAMNAYLSGPVSLLISLIPFGLAPLLMASVFWLYYRLRRKNGFFYGFMGLVSFWTAYEYLHQSWDLAFPWMTLGNGFAGFHQLVQWYSLTGVFGGTVWIWLSNILIFLLLWQKIRPIAGISLTKLPMAAASAIILPIAVSLAQYFTYKEPRNPSEVVVVQPNIDPYGKFGHIPPEDQLEWLIELSERAAKPNTEFFVWPETAISARNGINEDLFREHPAYGRILGFLECHKNGNVLSGIESHRTYQHPQTPTARDYGNGAFVDAFNAAVLVDRSSKLQFYHKSKLVPGVEQFPFRDALAFMKPLFAHFGGTTGGYGSQKEPSVLYSASGIGAAPVICYESIWGAYVSEYVRKGAQFIAVVTNDGWWGNTSGKDQHLLYAKLRAIENRRWVARSANTGLSGFINPRGDIVQQTGWWQPASLSQEINLNENLTFYARYGDVLPRLFFLTGLFAAFLLFKSLFKLKRKN